MMRYIPFTVLEFANRFRMGSLSIPNEFVMERLDAGAFNPDALSHFCGLFVEESDLIFVGFNMPPVVEGAWAEFPAWEVKIVHPLSDAARTVISYRLGNCVIGEPVPDELRLEVILYRSHEISGRGADFLISRFDLKDSGLLSKWRLLWQQALDRYHEEEGFAPVTFPEYLVNYERRKSFERNDLGFFEDSASIVKQSMLLPDGYVPGSSAGDDGHLDEVYALLRQLAALRNGWLSRGNVQMNTLLREIADNPAVAALNHMIYFEGNEGLNTFAMTMIYLKLRALCREINNPGGAARFELFITRILMDMPLEATIAITLTGMRFGIHEFSAMFSEPVEPVNERRYTGEMNSSPDLFGTDEVKPVNFGISQEKPVLSKKPKPSAGMLQKKPRTTSPRQKNR